MPSYTSTVSGDCVFYAIPDAHTCAEAKRYAQTMGNYPMYTVQIPYIPLYIATFNKAPIDIIIQILQDLESILVGNFLRMDDIDSTYAYGSYALIWKTRYDISNYMQEHLYRAHMKCLSGLAKYIDTSWHAALITQTKTRTPLPSKDEMSNIIDFGMGDARGLYRPHILLTRGNLFHNYKLPNKKISRNGDITHVGFAHAIHEVELGRVISVRP